MIQRLTSRLTTIESDSSPDRRSPSPASRGFNFNDAGKGSLKLHVGVAVVTGLFSAAVALLTAWLTFQAPTVGCFRHVEPGASPMQQSTDCWGT
jgi:hypothetical protein